LIKHVRKLGEDARVAVRNIRREANDHLRKLEHISEDEIKRLLDEVQKLTDEHIRKLDDLVARKEKDLSTV